VTASTAASVTSSTTSTSVEPTAAAPAKRDETAEVRGWIDVVLKTLGFAATAAGLFFVGFEYRNQRSQDREAAEERAREAEERSEDRAQADHDRVEAQERARFLEQPRCNADVHAHLLSTGGQAGFQLNVEVEFETKSAARIDFVYGPDNDETVVEVFAYEGLQSPPAAPIPGHTLVRPPPGTSVAVVPVELGEVIDPDERSADSLLIPLPPAPPGLVAYVVCLRVTAIQSARLELRARRNGGPVRS
jgi:hypothetical protein